MSSGCLSYLPISFYQAECLVGGYAGNLYSNFNSSHNSPVPLLFTAIQNLLTAAAGCQAATGVLIISQSGVFYLPPSPLTVSMGANGDVFLIKMRQQGEHELPSGEVGSTYFVPTGHTCIEHLSDWLRCKQQLPCLNNVQVHVSC